MINFKEIKYNDDSWELFARDFLSERGFYIESPPDRGADGGKDLLVTETIKGKLHRSEFRWLVSCKHFAHSNKSVNENNDEKNILERIKSFKADGFIGFYSTLPSSGLNSRLNALKQSKDIKDYCIFDGKSIENFLITGGYSHLLMRYLPESYKIIKPIELVLDKYRPLYCIECGKDLLIELYKSNYNANIVYAYKYDNESSITKYEEIYCCCKKCDSKAEVKMRGKGYMTSWTDISDIVIPVEFLRFIFATMNRLREGSDLYTEKAYKQEKDILIALSQKVLRTTTEKERERFNQLQSLPPH